VAAALLGLVLVLDLAWSLSGQPSSDSEFGLVDEPAHFATALLLVIALASLLRAPPSVSFWAAALVASVALDLDHVPAYLGWDRLTEGVPRPYPHALLTPAALALIGLAARGRARQVALGAAFGVCAHLLRDLAFGGGVALLWPLSGNGMRLPYAAFATLLSLAAAVALLRTRGAKRMIRSRGSAPAEDAIGFGSRPRR